MLRRAVAVELEVPKDVSKLLYSVESVYLSIVREVATYAVTKNVTSAAQLQRLLYHKYRQEYPDLHAHLVIQAIRQAVQIARSFITRRRRGLVDKPYPEVRKVSIRFTEDAWSYDQFVKSIAPVRLELSLLGGRREVWLRPHKRFWLFWWRVLTGEAELASTLMIKRRANKWYAIFIFEIKPRQELPQSVVAFDINENTVAVGKIDIKTTVGKVADWNRQYIMPQLYTIKTDFGRLARRYERVRNTIIEGLKPEFALPNGNYVNVTNTREFRKYVKHLREGVRKVGRVRQVASELTKTPAIIVTEELGNNPQEEMINGVGKSELRHRIKQTPFKALEKAVEDKALERGSKLFHVSSYRNSRVCPIHFTRLEGTSDWHTLQCPKGHHVDRDYASVMNMDWKLTPESWIKAFWWNMKSLNKNMNWRKYEGKSNPLIPYEIVQYIHAVLKTFVARLERCPAMLAQGDPMTRHRIQNEGGGKETSHALLRQGGGQLQLGVPKLNEGVIGEIANELSKSLNNLTIGTTYLGITIALRDIITSIIKIIERYNLRDKKVVVIYDDIDKYVGKHDQDALMAAANAIADKIVHEYIPRRLWVKVIFAVSDNAASRELDRLGSKGGYTPYLLWNLPKRAFREVVDEVVMKTGIKDVDFDLLWNLLGGNVRELGMIITGYNWNVKAWLQDIAINRIKETFKRHAESSGFGSVEKALAWLIKKGRVAARDYGLGEFTGQPDAVEGVLGLLENNIMIDVSPPGVWHLSELPSEPWIGKDYAYQIPAYYWAIRAMVETGKANVTPEDLLKTMQH